MTPGKAGPRIGYRSDIDGLRAVSAVAVMIYHAGIGCRGHLLSDLIVVCVAAVVAGCDGPKSIGLGAKEKSHWWVLRGI